jgi:FkbH-like protein
VRQQLPEVAAIQLPNDRSQFRKVLAEVGLFDSLTLTAEDRARTASYKANVERSRVQGSSTNLADYLTGLDITMTFGPPSDIEIPRVSQLSQKTNQFNLTTRRYTEAEVRSLNDSPDARVYVMHARDRVSDLGLVGVMVARLRGDRADIESCFISCRALGRSLEHAFLAAVANDIFSSGISILVGRYLQSSKNSLCKDYYQTCGLMLIEENATETTWRLDATSEPVATPAWVAIEFTAAAMAS